MASDSSSEFTVTSAEQLLAELRRTNEQLRQLSSNVSIEPTPSLSHATTRVATNVNDEEDDGESSILKHFLSTNSKPRPSSPSQSQEILETTLHTDPDEREEPSIQTDEEDEASRARPKFERPAVRPLKQSSKTNEQVQSSFDQFLSQTQSSQPSQRSDAGNDTRKLTRAVLAVAKASPVIGNEPDDAAAERFWSETVPDTVWETKPKAKIRSPGTTLSPSTEKVATKARVRNDGDEIGSAKKVARGKRLFALPSDEEKVKKVREVSEVPAKKKLVEEEEEEEMEIFDYRPQFAEDNIAAGREANIGPLVLEPTMRIKVHPWANRYLRAYQRDGIRFMFNNVSKNMGAILNDDMGLGKTVQIVALLLALLEKQGDLSDKRRAKDRRKARRESGVDFDRASEREGTILIIAPKSVLMQWGRELDTWGYFDWEDLSKCSGDDERQDLLARCHPRRRKGSVLPFNPEIVLAPYSLLTKEGGRDIRELLDVKFRLVVFDEVHTLKNISSNQTKNARKIKTLARIGLTGTIMQNNLKEFWTVISTIHPKALGAWSSFNEFYGKPIKLARTRTASSEALAVGQDRAKRVRAMMDKWVLRRTKKLIQDQLPQKKENVVFCKMTLLQQRVYERIALGRDAMLLKNAKLACDCGRPRVERGQCCYRGDIEAPLWKRFHPEGDFCRRCPYCLQLPMITKLINCCNHLDLLKADPMNESPEDVRFKHAFAKEAFGDDLNRIGGLDRATQFELVSSPELSGKLTVLGQLLSVWRLQPSARVLVFSHYTRLLDVIGKFLDRQGMAHSRIDGSTSASMRQEIVDDFNDMSKKSNFVFLISTKAGGLGLNLTAANIVVLFDSSWNPAFELQAQDRAYRLGQRRDVDVYRLISTGTIEDKTYCRQLYKMQLSSEALEGNREERFFEGVQGDKWRQGELFGVQNLIDYNPEGHMAELRRIYQWKNPVQPPSALSSSARAAMQAASRGNFAVETAIPEITKDGTVEETEEEEDGLLAKTTLSNADDKEVAEIFAAAYGLPLDAEDENIVAEATEVEQSQASQRKTSKRAPSSSHGLMENLAKIINSAQGDGEEALITDDEDIIEDDDVEEEEDIRARVNDIIHTHSHMTVDGKDLLSMTKRSDSV